MFGTSQMEFRSGAIKHHPDPESQMNITLGIGPLVALIAGILILIMPRLLNYIVALYLIVIGVLGLLGMGNYQFR
jgi:hypothetical protein